MLATSKGFWQILAKFALFYAIFFAMLYFFNFVAGRTLYSLVPFWIPLEIGLFFLVVFQKKLFQVESFKINWIQTIIFLIIAIIFFLIRINSEWLGREWFSLIGFIFLALAIFGLQTAKYFLNENRKESGIAIGFFAVYYFLAFALDNLWHLIANFSASIVAFLLSLSYSNIVLVQNFSPIIGANGFNITILKWCAGIESLALFALLFLLAAAIDLQKLNKKRLAIAFVIGLVLMYLITILRIYLIIVSGILISQQFALLEFHPLSALLLFTVFFIIYWFFAFKWAKNATKKL